MINQFWSLNARLNQAAALSGNVSIGAPLIAAAQLALLGVILTQAVPTTTMPWAGPAIAAMCVSVVFMVFSVQYGFWAVSYWNTPAEQLDWYPGAKVDLKQLTLQRVTMAHTQRLFRVIGAIAEWLFRVGVLFFLAGLACLLVPPSTASPQAAAIEHNIGVADWRDVAFWIVVGAFVLELTWISTSLLANMLVTAIARLNRGRPSHGSVRRASIRVAGRLTRLLWVIGRPFMPTRWKERYIAIERPDVASIQALLEETELPPEGLEAAVRRLPQEWGVEQVEWNNDKSVSIDKDLQGHVWTDWPWGLFTVGEQVTVVHPFGAIQGGAAELSERMTTIADYMSQRRRRGRLNHERLKSVTLHLDHLVKDAPRPAHCICPPLPPNPAGPNNGADTTKPTTADA